MTVINSSVFVCGYIVYVLLNVCVKLARCLCIHCAVTLLKILESVGYMSVSSDDLRIILQLLKVGEEESLVSCCCCLLPADCDKSVVITNLHV